jgi:putative ABC transport system substrate-binding protein
MMRRREFITLLGGAAVWPVAARAQQPDRMRRIGVLMSLAADDSESLRRMTAFVQTLQQLGWTDSRNVQIEYRWGASDTDRIRNYAAELAALAPDVVLAVGSPSVAALQQAARTLPIVFAQVTDPVGAGFVDSLAQPGGSTTGFTAFEYGMSAKWLELLKQIAPGITRVAVLRDPTGSGGIGQLGAIQSVAPLLQIELHPIDARDTGNIERVITAFARDSSIGLIVLPGGSVVARRDRIIELAAQHRVPAAYPFRYYVASGGLMSYGPDTIDPFRRAAGYIDRILKGEKPADLPVQAPTKFELVINLKTAKALGLEVPPTLLARADEVIE